MIFKKPVLISFVAATALTTLFAGTLEENFAAMVKKNQAPNATIISKSLIPSLDLYIAILEIEENKQMVPVYINKEGSAVIGISTIAMLPEEDMKIFNREIEKMQALQNSNNQEKLTPLFASLDKEAFLEIKSPNKDVKKEVIVVSDPECPYCRNELASIEEKLKETNIKIVFAPVHGKESLIKSQLILNEGKRAKNNDEKIKTLKKYFDEKVVLSDKQMTTDTKLIEDTRNKIFSSGVIRGVPFVYEVPTE